MWQLALCFASVGWIKRTKITLHLQIICILAYFEYRTSCEFLFCFKVVLSKYFITLYFYFISLLLYFVRSYYYFGFLSYSCYLYFKRRSVLKLTCIEPQCIKPWRTEVLWWLREWWGPKHLPTDLELYTYSLKITGLRLWGLLSFCMLLSLCVSVSFCLFLSFSPSFVFSSFLVYPGQMSICFKSHIEFKDT